MVLAVDIGNTNVVVGCFDDNGILFTERLATEPLSTELEYTVLIRTVLELNGMSASACSGCIISSVVPPVTQTVRAAVLRMTGKEPVVVGAGVKTGLKILIDNPAALGSDRVADAVAAAAEYPKPVIIVDMGTATTVSVVDADNRFLGGLIIPGVRVSLDSLSSRAAQLPAISLEPAKHVIGTNTVDCMKSGIIYSTASAVDGVIARVEEELGVPCTAVATGGNAGKIIPFCKRQIILDDLLLLKGLMLIYRKNHK
ncbi:MAG: type III pantothenate kinase [Oscillospiraceae bacterium]|nr:type III pantothenate kinase [Oscillospiraceae bacterium]MBR5722412.1 type III pantothenate kinase [Oscillospiraceae bacterium]